MNSAAPTLLDYVLGIGLGLSIGWFTGGCWNVMQGKTWTGRDKEK